MSAHESMGDVLARAKLRDDYIHAQQVSAVAREKVIEASLHCAADNFNEQPEDPGWQSEYNDDRLREVVIEAAEAFAAEKKLKDRLEGKVTDES